MSIFTFQMNYKLNKNQFNLIIKNLQQYCDKISCKKFYIEFHYNKSEGIYYLDIVLEVDNEDEKMDIDIINLVQFYIHEFEQGHDDKIF